MKTTIATLLLLTATIATYAKDHPIHAFYYDIKPLTKSVTTSFCKNVFSHLNTTMSEALILKNYTINNTYHFSKYNTLSSAIRKKPFTIIFNGKKNKVPVFNTMVDVVGNGDNHGYGIVAIGSYCSGKYYMAG